MDCLGASGGTDLKAATSRYGPYPRSVFGGQLSIAGAGQAIILTEVKPAIRSSARVQAVPLHAWGGFRCRRYWLWMERRCGVVVASDPQRAFRQRQVE